MRAWAEATDARVLPRPPPRLRHDRVETSPVALRAKGLGTGLAQRAFLRRPHRHGTVDEGDDLLPVHLNKTRAVHENENERQNTSTTSDDGCRRKADASTGREHVLARQDGLTKKKAEIGVGEDHRLLPFTLVLCRRCPEARASGSIHDPSAHQLSELGGSGLWPDDTVNHPEISTLLNEQVKKIGGGFAQQHLVGDHQPTVEEVARVHPGSEFRMRPLRVSVVEPQRILLLVLIDPIICVPVHEYSSLNVHMRFSAARLPCRRNRLVES